MEIPRKRLIDLDALSIQGKATMMKILERYEKEHPIKQIIVEDGDGKRTVILREEENG
jgi:hypothetical protein